MTCCRGSVARRWRPAIEPRPRRHFCRVYYEFPLTDAATAAGVQLASLQDQIARPNYKGDLARAQAFFGGRRFDDARAAFCRIASAAEGDDKELVSLRIAECDFNLKRYAAARDGVQPYLDRASRKAEARFFYLSSLRELRRSTIATSR